MAVAGYQPNIEDWDAWTPVCTPELTKAIEGYTHASFIIDGFTNGFALGMSESPRLCLQRPRIRPATKALREKVKEEVRNGRIVGPFRKPPIQGMKVSPAYVVPKPGSLKTRLIFDLSYPEGSSVNDNIRTECKSVKYCTVGEVAAYVYKHFRAGEAFMAKVDLADAYRLVPIRKADWRFLGMQVGGDLYVDRMLPMGASSSCLLFQIVSDALRWMFYRRFPCGATVFNYLDDFLFVAGSKDCCQATLRAFENLCLDLGVPVAGHKTVQATSSLVFLGIGLGSSSMSLHVPEDKARKYGTQLEAFLRLSTPTVRQWQKVAGVLVHLSQVVCAGRAFLGSVHDSLRGILSQQGHRRRRITVESRADLMVWLSFLQGLCPTRSFRFITGQESPRLVIATDASTSVGFGGVQGTRWFCGTWPSSAWSQINIAVLELYAVFVALSIWATEVTNAVILVQTDNEALVPVLNHLHSRDAGLRKFLRPVAALCLANNIKIAAVHIAGVDNVAPDLLSRGLLDQFHSRFPAMIASRVPVPEGVGPAACGLFTLG